MRLVLSVFVIATLACSRTWQQADEFASQLRCGSSSAQVTAISAAFDASIEVYSTGSPRIHGVRKGATELLLFFDEGDHLFAVQHREIRPITVVISRPRTNLCNGIQEIELTVESPPEYRGGTIQIGERRIPIDSPNATESVFLPPGTHVVAIDRVGRPMLTKTVTLKSDSGASRITF